MKTSYKKAFDFQAAAAAFMGEGKEETVFTDALNDVLDQIESLVLESEKKKPRLQRKHAMKDPRTGMIIRDVHKNMCYTEEGENMLDDEWFEFYEDEDAVHLKHSFVSEQDIPKDLPRILKRIFTGFVIKPADQEPETAAQKLINKTK